MGILKKVFGNKNKKKSDDELKADVLKKATDHWNTNSELTSFGEQEKPDDLVKKNMPSYETNDKVKKKNIRTVLLEIASRGEAGVFATSISDKAGVSQIDTSAALDFLTKNNFVEVINSAAGKKCYLTNAGRKYCISKEFNTHI